MTLNDEKIANFTILSKKICAGYEKRMIQSNEMNLVAFCVKIEPYRRVIS